LKRSSASRELQSPSSRLAELRRSTPAATFLSHFPMPAEQPTHHSPVDQFISPPSIHANRGSLSREDRPFRQTRTHSCLLTDDGVQRSFFFPDDGLGLGDRCRKVNVIVPMPRKLGKVMISRPQPDMDGPFLRIKHFLKIRVVCRDPGSLSPDTVSDFLR